MSNNNGRSTNTNTNGQNVSPAGNTKSMSSENKPDFLDNILQQADAASQGLSQAGLNYADAYVARNAERLGINVDSLSTTLALLNDPRTTVALAEIRAADLINERLGKCPEPMMAVLPYAKARIAVPSLPSFSQFYSSPLQEQSALPGSPEVVAEPELNKTSSN